jgi:hypothetical protein
MFLDWRSRRPDASAGVESSLRTDPRPSIRTRLAPPGCSARPGSRLGPIGSRPAIRRPHHSVDMYRYRLRPCFATETFSDGWTATRKLNIGPGRQAHERFASVDGAAIAGPSARLLRRQFERLAAEHSTDVVGEAHPLGLHPVDSYIPQPGGETGIAQEIAGKGKAPKIVC